MNKKSLIYRIAHFIKSWSDLFILFPVAAIGFSMADKWIRRLDPTAQTLEAGTLSVLNFNLLVWIIVFGGGYFIYNLYFHDFFKDGWTNGMTKFQASIINLILWLGVTTISFFIITRNL